MATASTAAMSRVNEAPLYISATSGVNWTRCVPIRAAMAGASAITATSTIRAADCTKANVRPRSSSATSSPSMV